MAERPKVRACRVCGCTEDRACDDGFGGGCHWLPGKDDLCSACAAAATHIVRMTREWPEGLKEGLSVATCNCGKFCERIPARHHRKMDELVRAHWRSVVEAAHG